MAVTMDKSKNRKYLALLAALAVVGAGGVWMLQDRDEGATLSHGLESAAHPGMSWWGNDSRATEDDGPCRFATGQRMAYDVETHSHTTLDMAPLMEDVRLGASSSLTAQSTAIDQAASRRWHLELEAVARATDGSSVLAARIEAEPTRLSGTIDPRAQAQPPAEALAETFLVRMDPQCNIREFGWRHDGDLRASRDQQQLLAGLSYRAPVDGERSYGGLLFDAVGRYYAQYDALGDGRITGRAVDYREPFGEVTGGMAPRFDVTASTIEITPGSGEWFASLDNTRALTLSMHDHEIGQLDSSVRAQRVEPDDWRAAVELRDDGWVWGLLLDQPRSGSGEHGPRQSELVGVSVEDAIAQYRALFAAQGSSARARPYLVEWLQANPEGAGEVLAMLRAGAFADEDGVESSLFLALAKADTSPATGALLEILRGTEDHREHKIAAAFAFSSASSPSADMLDAMVAATNSDVDAITRSSLAMSLGSFASRHAERAPELAAQASAQIEGWLADPADDRELAGSLLAAGNAGRDELVAAIDPYFDHEDPQIRQRAAHALRHMSEEEAYPRLLEGMGDDDEAVRAQAVETATAVSRARASALPEGIVDEAIERLDLQAPKREQQALLGLLGQAAHRGSEVAAEMLEQHFVDELDGERRDLDKLRALGRQTGPSWKAE